MYRGGVQRLIGWVFESLTKGNGLMVVNKDEGRGQRSGKGNVRVVMLTWKQDVKNECQKFGGSVVTIRVNVLQCRGSLAGLKSMEVTDRLGAMVFFEEEVETSLYRGRRL